jgi:hypothetical protein
MITAEKLSIYLAIKNPTDRSHLEDQLVLDGFYVSTFPTATALWDVFQQRRARFLITDRRFDDEFSGLDLVPCIIHNFG